MKPKLIGYWATTAILVLELLVGGEWDLAHRSYVVDIVPQLGYPAYILTIIGFWKVLGAIALPVPRFPRLKEWAYAGAFFEMTGAAASHIARGNKPVYLVAPIIFTVLIIASWSLRPQKRMLGDLSPARE